ncbi:ClpP/crotonase-like domain-containing protein [Dichotomocladium elegans]|nr:ClpP/crotonase-like domain-containing protein [Dichotomocladium elegans]
MKLSTAGNAGNGGAASAAGDVEIVTASKGSLREVVLNRPKKLNALNQNMVELMTPEIQAWEKSDLAKIILIKSSGGKGFCAGGDVKTVVDLAAVGNHAAAIRFFELEYQLDHLIGVLKTPYVAVMDGITMGGGVGLSVHAPFRIATEKTVFAMPETGIGFLPEVGGSFFLPRLDGFLGTYLGLTGKRLKGVDVLYAGVATHYVPSSRLPALESRLAEINNPTHELINTAIEEFSADLGSESGFSLGGSVMSAIDRCFGYNTVEEIIAAVEKEEDSQWKEETLERFREVSPTSLKVTLQQLRAGRKMSLGDCLKLEYRLVQKFLEGHDFEEGVNATLEKPRRKATWKPSTISEVDAAKIKSDYFDATLPLQLTLLSDKDYMEYPHRKYTLPSESDIQNVVTGEAADVGQYALNREEVIEYFVRERKGKQGVKQKVADVLDRKTSVIKNDESHSLKWAY